MPKDSVNVYLTIQSGSSEGVLASLTDKTRALDKETQLLKQATDALTKANKPLVEEQTKLQAQLKSSQKVVNDLQKAYDEFGDEMMKLDLDQAIEDHSKLKSELSAVNAQLGANQKTYKEYLEIVRKGSLSGIDGEASSDFDLSAVWGGLGIGEQLSSLAGEIGGAFLSSTFGDGVGGIASSALSSTITGASLGTAIAPGIGTAVGAAVGGILGAMGGIVDEWSNQDDAFKDYYGGLYGDVKDRSGEMTKSGSSIAAGREKDRISFRTLFGDGETADAYLDELVDLANHTPFLYGDLTAMSKTLATYGYSGRAGDKDYMLDTLRAIGDAGAALGMETSDMTAVAQALGRMKSSDKTTLEYLNILNDRGVGAVGYLADAYGVSQGDMYGMISKGQISGTEAVEIITAALRDAYAGVMEEQSRTFSGVTSTLEGLEQELDNAGGDAYNSLRAVGQNAMVDAYGGELGDAIKEINAVMGENQARRENLQDQYMRETLDAVLNGNQGKVFTAEQSAELAELSARYTEMKARYEASGGGDAEAGAEMESLYEQAQALGQAYFDNSEFVKKLNDTELDEIQAIRDNTAGLENASQASYQLSQELSKGMAVRLIKENYGAAIAEGKGGELPELATVGGHVGLAEEKQEGYYGYNGIWHPHAFGLDRAPYDGYPALLHEGERVLTASQARAQDAGGGAGSIQLTVTGNSFTGTGEEMADQLWSIIIGRLEQAAAAAAPK